ncbi:MAG: hypothetical protein VZR35_03735 [Lachnospiraceae bacterium]|jgi:hypothetical protein|nr:hypothetical protein [Lachnospiraceae bacterium]MEE3457693.1 hypothetical protein [Lachnospiraceae bacterium]
MPEAEYHIPVRRGHSVRLRFWFDPISEEILAGNADLPIKDELSCSNPASKKLLLPLISRNFEGVFYFKNELNLIPMKDIEKLTADLNACADLLESGSWSDPLLRDVRQSATIEVLVPEDVYTEHYENASRSEKAAAVASHLTVIAEFYRTVADYLTEMTAKYGRKGYQWIAVSTPS